MPFSKLDCFERRISSIYMYWGGPTYFHSITYLNKGFYRFQCFGTRPVYPSLNKKIQFVRELQSKIVNLDCLWSLPCILLKYSQFFSSSSPTLDDASCQLSTHHFIWEMLFLLPYTGNSTLGILFLNWGCLVYCPCTRPLIQLVRNLI